MEQAPDEQVMDVAVAESRIIVTCNGDDYEELSRAMLDAGRHHPGVIVCWQCKYDDFDQLLSRLRAMLDTFACPEDYVDRVRYLARA